MAIKKKDIMTNKPTFTEIKGCLVSKDGKQKDKMTAEQLSEFCKSVECPWLRNVNFGNGVHIPHCVLRGNEVKPHDRCINLNAFVEFAKISKEEVEHINTPIEDEEEETL